MPTAAEHLAAFRAIDALLRDGAVANAHATAGGDELAARQLEHTLDRLALLHGTGTVENLSTSELFETAIANELRLAQEPGGDAHGHEARAGALLDAARRGNRVRARRPHVAITRGVYVSPLSPALEQMLVARREPFVRFADGAVVVLPEAELPGLRAAGHWVDVLYLDPDELFDDPDPAEFARRQAIARAAPDRVGDSHERHRQRGLLAQSTVLRNLRDRLAGDHPGAHRALAPIVAGNRAQLEHAARHAPAALARRAVTADALGASIDLERELQDLVGRWAAEPDTAGFAPRYAVVAHAGHHLAALEQRRRTGD